MPRISRRSFLAGAGAVAAGAAAGAATGGGIASASSQPATEVAQAEFHGFHQPSVLAPPLPAAMVASFDVVAGSRRELAELFKAITNEARWLVNGGVPPNLGPGAQTDDNGILGPSVPRYSLRFMLGMGASLFGDDRYGLAAAKPAGLVPMRTFPNDHLDPAQTHGDLVVQLAATHPDVVVHALRHLMKHTQGSMQPRWRIDGSHSPARPSGTPRNYLGFRDGIANPDVASASVTKQLIWVDGDSPGPAWTAGGTFYVVRIIRMIVEFWDRVSLQEQETMIGRRRDSGAPLDGNSQNDIPDYKADPLGNVIPLTAHMRLANPRTAATEPSRIYRIGYNYDRGLDVNGNLDQGLIFTCFQQDTKRQFEAVQTRLIDEPLVDYVSPVGGGYFFVPPGVRDESDWYAREMFGGNPV